MVYLYDRHNDSHYNACCFGHVHIVLSIIEKCMVFVGHIGYLASHIVFSIVEQ